MARRSRPASRLSTKFACRTIFYEERYMIVVSGHAEFGAANVKAARVQEIEQSLVRELPNQSMHRCRCCP